MLVFFGCLALLLGSLAFRAYVWYVVVGSFFLLSFVSLFNVGVCGWWFGGSLFSLDLVSSCMVTLSLWLGALMLLANWGVYLSMDGSKSFLAVVVFLIFTLLLGFSVDNFFGFYIFFELSLVPTFFLIVGWGYQPERLGASMYMVLYTVGASLPLLGCLLFCWGEQGHLSFHLAFVLCKHGFGGEAFFFFFVLAFLVKVPVFFVHLWLPKAHVEAPVAGSMILAGVLLKLGGYGLVRAVGKLAGLVSFGGEKYLALVLWGGVLTGVVCVRQVDMKSLIAYSSIGHMGLFVGGILGDNVWGWQGGLGMLLGHGLCSSAMFALANVAYESAGTRSMLLVKGFLSFFPFLAFLWFLVCSSNMAAPPSLNLVSEILLFVSILGGCWLWAFPLGLLSFLGGAYSLYLYTSGQHGGFVSSCQAYLPAKSRSFLMILCHWLPLNALFLSSGRIVDFVS
uniref:NADH-ubiquinone oxidoreductase chain 4 n=1 Tax=Notospermus geniculatus TaxID=416868 RepID=A0A4Y5RWJ5_9BILA|nr:NADH dehydrogenase subunit 4 [Notospermus geniculatus]QCZ36415.1 NADH dehydrogenase subunit 4 [Notospermus geniculatus]